MQVFLLIATKHVWQWSTKLKVKVSIEDILKWAPKCSKKPTRLSLMCNLSFFHQQSKLHMEGFRSLREGEAVDFMFKKSSKGLESVWVTGPDGAPCLGSERRPKSAQKRRSKAER